MFPLEKLAHKELIWFRMEMWEQVSIHWKQGEYQSLVHELETSFATHCSGHYANHSAMTHLSKQTGTRGPSQYKDAILPVQGFPC